MSYIGEDEAAFIASCKEILSNCKVFPVCYDKIEVFGFLLHCGGFAAQRGGAGSGAKEDRRKMGERLARLHAGRCVYPHTTLLQDMQADLGKIAQHLEENFEPFCGEVQTDRVLPRGESWVYDCGYRRIAERVSRYGKICTVFNKFGSSSYN